MKQYPSIKHWNKGLFGEHCIAFDKIDGSNLRFEWSKKRGWYKFGTRRTMITPKDENFGDGIGLFLNKYGEDLTRIFKDHKSYRNIDKFIVFCEYVGSNSLFGKHDPEDEKDVILIDINPHKKGFISPKDFLNDFGSLKLPRVIYEGEYNQEFIDGVREGKYDVFEGVVAKGQINKKPPWSVKIKTRAWLDMLKTQGGIEALLEEFGGNFHELY